MVAGRRLWGHNEEKAAQHKTGRSGDLSVKAVVENRLGAGEARCLASHVEAGGQVDQKNHGEAEQAEREDDSAQAPAAFVAQCDEGEEPGEQRDWNQ
jgi:hypothetical protein